MVCIHRTVLLSVLLMLSSYCYAQKYNADSLFNEFKRNMRIQGNIYGGRVGIDNETKESYYLLMSIVQVKDLIKHTDDSMPVVRAEIFAGLVQKNASDSILRRILLKHVNDTTHFIYNPTDVVFKWSVNEYMQFIFENRGKIRATPRNYKTLLQEARNEPHIIIPGLHHGVINRDSFLKADGLMY